MSTETGVESTGVSCHRDGCPGQIMKTTGSAVGDGTVITYQCSACKIGYEETPGSVGVFRKVSELYAEDDTPFNVGAGQPEGQPNALQEFAMHIQVRGKVV